MHLTLSGDDKIVRKLRAMSEAAKGEMLERGLIAAALLVVNDAKRNAPYLSGTLRRSLHIGGHTDLSPDFEPIREVADLIPGATPTLPPPRKLPGYVTVYVGTNLEYARWVEFGTTRMAAQPFLRPAIDENRSRVEEEFMAAVADLIEGLDNGS